MNTMTTEKSGQDKISPMATSRKRTIYVGLGIVALAGLWLAFRPELLFIDQSVSESLPAGSQDASAASTTLASGMFHEVAHETKGTATVHQLSDGNRVVRLTNFETSNGPDVHLFLVAADDAADSDAVKNAGYVDLGKLKGNIGDQNYDIPSDLDLSQYRAVTVWCNRFGVNFGTAPLM